MLTLNSPAKINLFLRILRKRADGYHELASLMQAISLADTIHFSFSDRNDLTCTDPAIPTDHNNLIWKALELFRHKTGKNVYLKAHIEKRIPHQAGLGGGSSNAATTLWALNQLCGTSLTDETLAHWAGALGSDVSFFLSQGTAYCTGRGEIFRPLSPLSSETLWIVKPAKGLSTADVYRNIDFGKLEKRDPERFLSNIQAGKPGYFNDLEDSAFRLMPALDDLKQSLLQHSTYAMMSGSGSAFFCGNVCLPMLESSQLFCTQATFISRQPGKWFCPL